MDTRLFTSNREKLIAAFSLGDIYAIGGAVYNAKHQYVFLTSDLVEFKNDAKIRFERVDSGGSPTWRLKNLRGEIT